MARDRRTKVFTYKHVSFHRRAGMTLQAAVVGALEQLPTVGRRREPLAPDGEPPIWRLVGQYTADQAFVFGVLVQYVPGTNPTFLVDDENATSIAVEQLPAPRTTDGKSREPLEGMLFFAISGNHVVLMQSSALKSMHLEQHLLWLMRVGGTIEADNAMQLVDQPPVEVRQRLESHAVRELNIGGELITAPAVEPQRSESVARPAYRGRQVNVDGEAEPGVLEALRSLLSPTQFSRLDLEGLADSNLEYTLQIRYRQETTDKGQRFMDTLGSALRHAEGVDTKIVLVGGGEIKGNDLKLTGPRRIEHINGVPNPVHVFEEMRAWLLEKLRSGDVSA